MSITREQVADLQPGDVVRLVEVESDGSRYVHEGPVKADGRTGLSFSSLWLRSDTGDAARWVDELTVVSRALRPLYVNHDRTEPVAGDVVRDANSDDATCWDYVGGNHHPWATVGVLGWHGREERDALPSPLRLLVDGETGTAVTS